MTAQLCANGCGKPVPVRAHGPKPKYCGDACRQAAHRAAAEAPHGVSLPAPVTSRAPRASGAGRRVGLLCPVDSEHGPLLPWTHNPDFGWYCPDQWHDGHGDRPQSRAFFTTQEAEAGLTNEAFQPTAAPSRAGEREAQLGFAQAT